MISAKVVLQLRQREPPSFTPVTGVRICVNDPFERYLFSKSSALSAAGLEYVASRMTRKKYYVYKIPWENIDILAS